MKSDLFVFTDNAQLRMQKSHCLVSSGIHYEIII
jgi:hypothetical protein